jgi:hypothetical protein
MPFRHLSALVPARAVAIPTCDHCRERFIDDATALALDSALEAAFATRQHELLKASIEVLCTRRTQREWEKRLGLSPGYLSRLKAGKESSVALTTCLLLLAREPDLAWDRVVEVWSPPVEATRAAIAPSSFCVTHLQLLAAAGSDGPVSGELHDASSSVIFLEAA